MPSLQQAAERPGVMLAAGGTAARSLVNTASLVHGGEGKRKIYLNNGDIQDCNRASYLQTDVLATFNQVIRPCRVLS